MKKFLVIFLLSVSTLCAQNNKHEQIRALKTAYITDKLNFSTTDAEKFWPVYNEYEKQFHSLRKKQRNDVYLELRDNWDNLSDDQANQLIDKHLQFKFEDIEIQKQRTQALRKIISPKQIISLNKVEEDFKRELLDQYRRKKNADQ